MTPSSSPAAAVASMMAPPAASLQYRIAKKNPRAAAFCVLFSLFLLGVLFFSKRSLEPGVSVLTSRLPLPSNVPVLHRPSPPAALPPVQIQRVQAGSLCSPPESPREAKAGSLSPPPLEASERLEDRIPDRQISNQSESFHDAVGGTERLREQGLEEKCDLYDGGWEEDREARYPLYRPGSCPYVDDAYACQENGRPDTGYLKWRWKPYGCDLPRFNATDFLERLRGRRLMLVGDSMNRNQFESMLCLLREGLPDKSRVYETRGYKITKGRGYFIFKFVDYNCTIEFCRSHFLVREGTHLTSQGTSRPTLSIDRIDKSSSRWKHADILIFNTGHWWTHGKTSRGKDYYKEGDVTYPKFDAVEAYKRAMRTWGMWIDEHMIPGKNLIFYRGYSTAHFRGGDWDSGGTCNGELEPITNSGFLHTYPPKMKIVEEVIRDMRFPVILLNVSRLTNFRKDGHPSVYMVNQTEGRRVSRRKQDCSHWCLPGVPDAWNELIYATLVLQDPLAQ